MVILLLEAIRGESMKLWSVCIAVLATLAIVAGCAGPDSLPRGGEAVMVLGRGPDAAPGAFVGHPVGDLPKQQSGDVNQYLNNMLTWGVQNTQVAVDFEKAGYTRVSAQAVSVFADGVCWHNARASAVVFSLNAMGITYRDSALIAELMGTVPSTCKVMNYAALDQASNVFFVDMIDNSNAQRIPPPSPAAPTRPSVAPSNGQTKTTFSAICAGGAAGFGVMLKDRFESKAGNLAAVVGLAALGSLCPVYLPKLVGN